ncbi:hypothetical protein EG68_11648 [Paragonimus skrjabini miyazakii]|uniref:Uncharacterized protein n=1 Tax=Paragonimus skrjabini miyazakii TaxID=59628 RepID=A0A8S9YKV9_9TREM|nr:hypothetical protein EG68_11648 [Paragonimus skrjabini miyazakii]
MSGSGARPVGRGMLIPKKTKITSDYRIQNSVLGTGINGKVLRCTSLQSGRTFDEEGGFLLPHGRRW